MHKFGLFNVDFFLELKIEKSCNDIALMKVKTLIGSNCKENFVSCQFYNRDISFKIVNIFLLLKAASSKTDF